MLQKQKICVQPRLRREGGGWEMREGVCRKVGEESQYSLGNGLWRRNWEVFWLVLHSGRVQRLPEGGYKKTKEAGGHVERLLKGSKHPLHNPTTATITTTGEEKETLHWNWDHINTKLLLQKQTFSPKYSTSWSSSLNFIGPSGQLVLQHVLNMAIHQIQKTDSHNKQQTDMPMQGADGECQLHV